MTVRTLAEAAAEVLNRTRAMAPSEPMHHMPHHVNDLGGATYENPEGDDIGTNAASHMGKAMEPGTRPASSSKEAMKKLMGHPEDHEGHELVDPMHLNGPGVNTAGHEYAHPTGVMKEEKCKHCDGEGCKHCMEEEDMKHHKRSKDMKHHKHMEEMHHHMHHMHTEHSKAYHAHMEAHRHHMEEGNMEEARHHMEEAHRCATQHFAETGYPVHDEEYMGSHPHVSRDMEECYGNMEETVELSEEEIAEARQAKHHMMKEKMKHMGMKEDMDALFNGENLSEEFKVKAATIFESAVIARAIQVVEEMEEEILAAAEESVEEIKNELEEQIDAYLNYMVEEWVNNNEVAIESGLRSEIAEDFMAGIKRVFEENYIEVPEERLDVIETMAEEIEELKERLNETLNTNIELSQAIVESTKNEIITAACQGLTATQAEKVKTLAEGVEFTTEGEYIKKMDIIRENYFKSEPQKVKGVSKAIQLSESQDVVAPAEVSSSMENYVRALSRTLPQ
jgi:hypothetical protein